MPSEHTNNVLAQRQRLGPALARTSLVGSRAKQGRTDHESETTYTRRDLITPESLDMGLSAACVQTSNRGIGEASGPLTQVAQVTIELGHVEGFLRRRLVSNQLSMRADVAPNCFKLPQLTDEFVVVYCEQGGRRARLLKQAAAVRDCGSAGRVLPAQVWWGFRRGFRRGQRRRFGGVW